MDFRPTNSSGRRIPVKKRSLPLAAEAAVVRFRVLDSDDPHLGLNCVRSWYPDGCSIVECIGDSTPS